MNQMNAVDASLEEILKKLRSIHMPSHALAKEQLRRPAIEGMRAAIDAELTLTAYEEAGFRCFAKAQPAAN